MAELTRVAAAKGVYYGPITNGLPTVGSSMSWSATADEVQTITITGTPTGGTLKLTHQGVPGTPVEEETSALTFDDVFGDVDTAMEALASIAAGDIAVTGGAWPGTAMVFTFAVNLAAQPILPIKPTSIALTGGTDVAVATVRTTMGMSAWTEIENIDDAGVEITFKYEGPEVNEMGRKMPVDELISKAGVSSIKFATTVSTEARLLLALPDATDAGAYITGGASKAKRAIAVHCDNCVWWFPVMSAVGEVALSYNNPDYAKPPFEFKGFEDEYSPKGTPNWRRYPIT